MLMQLLGDGMTDGEVHISAADSCSTTAAGTALGQQQQQQQQQHDGVLNSRLETSQQQQEEEEGMGRSLEQQQPQQEASACAKDAQDVVLQEEQGEVQQTQLEVASTTNAAVAAIHCPSGHLVPEDEPSAEGSRNSAAAAAAASVVESAAVLAGVDLPTAGLSAPAAAGQVPSSADSGEASAVGDAGFPAEQELSLAGGLYSDESRPVAAAEAGGVPDAAAAPPGPAPVFGPDSGVDHPQQSSGRSDSTQEAHINPASSPVALPGVPEDAGSSLSEADNTQPPHSTQADSGFDWQQEAIAGRHEEPTTAMPASAVAPSAAPGRLIVDSSAAIGSAVGTLPAVVSSTSSNRAMDDPAGTADDNVQCKLTSSEQQQEEAQQQQQQQQGQQQAQERQPQQQPQGGTRQLSPAHSHVRSQQPAQQKPAKRRGWCWCSPRSSSQQVAEEYDEEWSPSTGAPQLPPAAFSSLGSGLVQPAPGLQVTGHMEAVEVGTAADNDVDAAAGAGHGYGDEEPKAIAAPPMSAAGVEQPSEAAAAEGAALGPAAGEGGAVAIIRISNAGAISRSNSIAGALTRPGSMAGAATRGASLGGALTRTNSIAGGVVRPVSSAGVVKEWRQLEALCQGAAINDATPPALVMEHGHSTAAAAAAGDAEVWAPEVDEPKMVMAPVGVDFGRLMDMVGELQSGLKELQTDLSEGQLQQLQT
jgi:hypothetical protein